jgi:dihydrofolate reductase
MFRVGSTLHADRRPPVSAAGSITLRPYPFGPAVRLLAMTTSATRRLYVSIIVSLDGFIEGPGHDLSWFEDDDPQFNRYAEEMVDSVGLALFGRRSYELMVSYWPDAEQNPRSPYDLDFARKMNALPKIVLSRTLREATWRNTRVLGERVGETLAELKRQPGKPIVAWAGAGLIATLAELDLVDEYRLIVHPVLLGAGTPLFPRLAERRKLRLVRTTQLGQNLAVLCYEPAR